MSDLLARYHGVILDGLLTTIALVGAGFLVGIALGALLAVPLSASAALPRALARAYVEVIRNTPFLIQAMLLFALFGVLRIRIEPAAVGAAAVAIYTAAYMAEILRGALHSIPTGQYDAARALGLPRHVRALRVIAPQLMPFVLPAGVNLLATVTKESAFLSAVSVAELTYSGQVVIAQTFRVFEVWAIVGLLYLALVLAVLGLAQRLERRLRWVVSTG
ncbi:MAG: amino acid ABC transporter permease [Alphaproteobacteria bacterium HGW-Alphaproteobacteria-2]|nr:MAG: amino acid ABC transporter permease [Alphaproteobacteria bacterium HGW-Alphaproteobacteria-2]